MSSRILLTPLFLSLPILGAAVLSGCFTTTVPDKWYPVRDSVVQHGADIAAVMTKGGRTIEFNYNGHLNCPCSDGKDSTCIGGKGREQFVRNGKKWHRLFDPPFIVIPQDSVAGVRIVESHLNKNATLSIIFYTLFFAALFIVSTLDTVNGSGKHR